MQDHAIYIGKRARGYLLLRALQHYIRALDQGRQSVPVGNLSSRDVLSAAIAEAEDAETDLVAVLNTWIPDRNPEAHSGDTGPGPRQPGPPPDDNLSHF